MKITKKTRIASAMLSLYFIAMVSSISAVIIDADYVTLYPGEDGKVSFNIENNENFDIENIDVSIDLSNLPFTSVGSSSRDIDSIDEDDDDSVTFTILPSTDIVPGDYSIPYRIDYVDASNNSANFARNGSFGIRVSARTDLDFSAETRDTAIVGRDGQVSIEIINRGLGEVKSVSIQVFPNGFELLSGDKVFVGTVDADDSDTASFDVIYKSVNPTFSAKITYKDFDNTNQTETVSFPLKVYTEEQALQLGLISKSRTGIYIAIALVLVVLWYFWRRIRKRRKLKEKEKMMGR